MTVAGAMERGQRAVYPRHFFAAPATACPRDSQSLTWWTCGLSVMACFQLLLQRPFIRYVSTKVTNFRVPGTIGLRQGSKY
jgi:hypothetical protein